MREGETYIPNTSHGFFFVCETLKLSEAESELFNIDSKQIFLFLLKMCFESVDV